MSTGDVRLFCWVYEFGHESYGSKIFGRGWENKLVRNLWVDKLVHNCLLSLIIFACSLFVAA